MCAISLIAYGRRLPYSNPGNEKVSQIYLAVCVFSLSPPTGKEKTSLTYRLYRTREDPTVGDSSMKETDKQGIFRPPMSD